MDNNDKNKANNNFFIIVLLKYYLLFLKHYKNNHKKKNYQILIALFVSYFSISMDFISDLISFISSRIDVICTMVASNTDLSSFIASIFLY